MYRLSVNVFLHCLCFCFTLHNAIGQNMPDSLLGQMFHVNFRLGVAFDEREYPVLTLDNHFPCVSTYKSPYLQLACKM